ncbi:MAG: hypothetical protein NZO16_05995 [Deltaproteobacteria bacterium]|nr:hypothetical protein [Deltaproteobacteria bacterium]
MSVHVGNWSACLPCLVQSISGSEALPPGSFVATLYPSKYDSNARQQQRFLTLSELELLLDEPSVFAAILHAANQIARHKDLNIGEPDSIIQNIRKAYSLLMENSALRALLD